jgi:hypothetical protein
MIWVLSRTGKSKWYNFGLLAQGCLSASYKARNTYAMRAVQPFARRTLGTDQEGGFALVGNAFACGIRLGNKPSRTL